MSRAIGRFGMPPAPPPLPDTAPMPGAGPLFQPLMPLMQPLVPGQTAVTPQTVPTGLTTEDTLEQSEGGEAYGGEHSALGVPELPASESVFAGAQQQNLKAFTSQLKFGTDLFKQPGLWTDIQTRAQELTQNPQQSFVLGFMPSAETSTIVSQISTNLQTTSAAIRSSLPPDQQTQYDSIVSAVTNSPMGQMIAAQQGPVTLAMLAEASADYIICACAQMNNLDGQKNKDLIGQFIQQAQLRDESNQTQMDQMMGATNEKLEATAVQKAAAAKSKVWNAIFAAIMIVVAVVMAVLSIFTFGGTAALSALAVMAAVAAITMAVLTVVTELPAILDTMGVDTTKYRAFLAGPAGKVILALKIVCAVCALAYGVGSLATAAGGAAQAGTSAAESAGSSTAQAGAAAAATSSSSAATATEAGTSTAVTVTKSALSVASAGVSIGQTIMNHSQAEIDRHLDELNQDVQDLQAGMAKVKADMEGNKVEKKALEDDMKAVMDQMQQIMTQMFAAMETQSQTSQVVGRFLAPGR